MKHKHIIAHMKSAFNYAACSTAKRLQVGCIIVKNDRIISIGYNGMPSGWDNVCENKTIDENENQILVTKPEVLHAESNAPFGADGAFNIPDKLESNGQFVH